MAETIVGQTYHNLTMDITNKTFDSCRFESCKLVGRDCIFSRCELPDTTFHDPESLTVESDMGPEPSVVVTSQSNPPRPAFTSH